MQADPTNGPDLICLSGLLCDAEIWHGVVERLGHRVNARIFGFAGFSSITEMAKHVLAEAPPRFAVAGHSMGGRVALEIYRLAPSRVAGIALLNTGVHPPAPHEPRSRGELVAIAKNDGMSALAARWLVPMLGTQRDANDPLVARLTRMIERSTPDSFAAQVNALLNRPPAIEVLSSIDVPALLLSGTADTWSPPAQHEAMRAMIPGSKLVVVEHAGHMSLVEQPEEVAAALAEWLGRVVDRATANRVSRLDEREIADECMQLIYRYARLNDSSEWDELSGMFIDEGILHRPSDPGKPIQGRGEILASFKARPPRLTRHIVSNIEVTVYSPVRASAISSVVLYVAEMVNGISTITSTSVGLFEDKIAKRDGKWLFSERRGQMSMRT